MLAYAILIDAGFLKPKLKAAKGRGSAVLPSDVSTFVARLGKHPALANQRLHRTYFYDAKPLTGTANHPNGTLIDFGQSTVARANTSLHAGLERTSFVALRYGELVHQGWRIKKRALSGTDTTRTFTTNDLEPHIQQKGVDMRIGLDIASLTLKRQVQTIVLVTADSDFIPAMKFARREGAQLYLVTFGHGLRESVHQHADLVIDADAASFLSVE